MLLFVLFASLDELNMYILAMCNRHGWRALSQSLLLHKFVYFLKAFNCTILFICLRSTHVSQCIERCNDYRKEKCIIIWSELLDNVCLFIAMRILNTWPYLCSLRELWTNFAQQLSLPQLWPNLHSHNFRF